MLPDVSQAKSNVTQRQGAQYSHAFLNLEDLTLDPPGNHSTLSSLRVKLTDFLQHSGRPSNEKLDLLNQSLARAMLQCIEGDNRPCLFEYVQVVSEFICRTDDPSIADLGKVSSVFIQHCISLHDLGMLNDKFHGLVTAVLPIALEHEETRQQLASCCEQFLINRMTRLDLPSFEDSVLHAVTLKTFGNLQQELSHSEEFKEALRVCILHYLSCGKINPAIAFHAMEIYNPELRITNKDFLQALETGLIIQLQSTDLRRANELLAFLGRDEEDLFRFSSSSEKLLKRLGFLPELAVLRSVRNPTVPPEHIITTLNNFRLHDLRHSNSFHAAVFAEVQDGLCHDDIDSLKRSLGLLRCLPPSALEDNELSEALRIRCFAELQRYHQTYLQEARQPMKVARNCPEESLFALEGLRELRQKREKLSQAIQLLPDYWDKTELIKPGMPGLPHNTADYAYPMLKTISPQDWKRVYDNCRNKEGRTAIISFESTLFALQHFADAVASIHDSQHYWKLLAAL